MKAADIRLAVAPPHRFTLGPGAWSTLWTERPLKPIVVGLRRPSGADRSQANVEAIARTDRAFRAARLDARCHMDDSLWRRSWEVAFLHYLLGYALCHPEDAARPMWEDQDGELNLVQPQKGDVPLVSRRLSDAGIVRCFDELDALERDAGVGMRRATDGELREFGAALADGSILTALRAHPSDDARAVEEHLRVLLGQAMDLIDRGREAPHPAAL